MKYTAVVAIVLCVWTVGVAFAVDVHPVTEDTIVPEADFLNKQISTLEVTMHHADIIPPAKTEAIPDPPDNASWEGKPSKAKAAVHHEKKKKTEKKTEKKHEKHEKKEKPKEKPAQCQKFCGACAQACPVCKPPTEAAKCHAGCDSFQRDGHKQEEHMRLKGQHKRAEAFAKSFKTKVEACAKKCDKLDRKPSQSCLKCAHGKSACHKCKECHDGPIAAFMQSIPRVPEKETVVPAKHADFIPPAKKTAIPPDKEAFEPSKEAQADCAKACAGVEGPRDAAACRACHEHHRKHDEKQQQKEKEGTKSPCERTCGKCAKSCPICKPDEGPTKKCFAACDAQQANGHKKEEALRKKKDHREKAAEALAKTLKATFEACTKKCDKLAEAKPSKACMTCASRAKACPKCMKCHAQHGEGHGVKPATLVGEKFFARRRSRSRRYSRRARRYSRRRYRRSRRFSRRRYRRSRYSRRRYRRSRYSRRRYRLGRYSRRRYRARRAKSASRRRRYRPRRAVKPRRPSYGTAAVHAMRAAVRRAGERHAKRFLARHKKNAFIRQRMERIAKRHLAKHSKLRRERHSKYKRRLAQLRKRRANTRRRRYTPRRLRASNKAWMQYKKRRSRRGRPSYGTAAVHVMRAAIRRAGERRAKRILARRKKNKKHAHKHTPRRKPKHSYGSSAFHHMRAIIRRAIHRAKKHQRGRKPSYGTAAVHAHKARPSRPRALPPHPSHKSKHKPKPSNKPPRHKPSYYKPSFSTSFHHKPPRPSYPRKPSYRPSYKPGYHHNILHQSKRRPHARGPHHHVHVILGHGAIGRVGHGGPSALRRQAARHSILKRHIGA